MRKKAANSRLRAPSWLITPSTSIYRDVHLWHLWQISQNEALRFSLLNKRIMSADSSHDVRNGRHQFSQRRGKSSSTIPWNQVHLLNSPALNITNSLPVLLSSSILRSLKDGLCTLQHRWSGIARWASFNWTGNECWNDDGSLLSERQ